MITGSIVALATPMKATGEIDWDALRQLVAFHLENGTDAIVAAGTTGEPTTMSFAEHFDVIRCVVETVAGKIPVIAGTGANATSEAVELARYAKEVGADYCLSVAPYYNKPTQEGLYQHFKAVAEQAGIPVILYNVPGRTCSDIYNETVFRLAEDRFMLTCGSPCLAWLRKSAFGFDDVDIEDVERQLAALQQHLNNSELTLDTPREEWVQTLAGWFPAAGAQSP